MKNKTLAVLLAVYDPRIDWLTELLDSLNQQTYEPICLYVRDDASPHVSLDTLAALLQKHITRFPFVLHQNERNLGSNETFAALVRDCHEDYVAFCDQDDIWLPEKLTNTVRRLEESPLSPRLVCTNVKVIDGEGNLIAEKMEEHRRRHVFMGGEGIAPTLIYRNFVMGCTVVMRREIALSYLPFPTAVVHDHYLAFRAACDGTIDVLTEPQMLYRVYGGNQTGVMTGVVTKDDYRKHRIDVFDARVQAFSTVADLPALTEARAWGEARKMNFERQRGGLRALWKLRKVNFVTSLFELVALRLPMPLFRLAIRLVQRGAL